MNFFFLFLWFLAVDHLEKSRDIIKRLKDERRDVEAQLSDVRAEMERRLSDSQQSIDTEKDEEIKELRRGKVEALQILQVKASNISHYHRADTMFVFSCSNVWRRD